jgi:methyl-accepting chemotaxis protein
VIAIVRLGDLAAHSGEIDRNWLPCVEYLSAIDTAKSDVRIAQMRYVGATSTEEVAQFDKQAQEALARIEKNMRLYEPLISDVTERGIWEQFTQQWRAYMDVSAKVMTLRQQGKNQEATQALFGARDIYLAAGEALKKDVDRNRDGAAREVSMVETVYARSRAIIIALLLGSVALGVLVAMFVGRVISRPLTNVVSICQRMAAGRLDNAIEATSADEVGTFLIALGEMQGKLKSQIESERAQSAATFRIKSALDKASASVMLADENFNIIYTNDSAQTLFGNAQADFRRDVPTLDASRLIGTNIDVFHKNPAHQRRVLADLRGTHTADIRIGSRSMRIAASPVVDAEGNRIGTVVEWFDRTQEVRSEEEVSAVVKHATEGNLAERVPLEGKSEFYLTLARGLNQLLDATAEIVRKVSTAASEVHRGAQEISEGNANLSQRTEEQSSSLEETASSMEEMTSTVKQNADNAGQANQLATAARDQAEKGGAVVGKAVKAMSEINESSKRIADIIGVIDEIAFQTNLLALNAAVEAARAGEQGRGFAVVATEVRSLAGRSATAAKEIKDLIQDSVRKVDDGSVLVTQSGQALDQIVTSVKKVSDIVAEIASASREQSSGIEQVNRAVMQMDEVTQQNAALVEQASAASQSMSDQARELTRLMERYRVGDAHSGATPAAEPIAHSAVAPRAVLTERRGADRPWAGKPGKSTAARSERVAQAASRPAATAGAGGDAEWTQF